MTLLILGIALFWATHLLKIYAPARRAALGQKLSENGAKGLMAVLTLLAIYVIVIGYQAAPVINLWFPPSFLTHINNALMALAAVFFVAGGIPSGIRTRIRHPQLTAVKTWAVAHLLVNGDLASVILFGAMLAWAVVAVIGINKRDGAWVRPAPGTMKGKLLHAAVAIAVIVAMMGIHVWAGVLPFPASGG